jgi:putative transcriptional regulator
LHTRDTADTYYVSIHDAQISNLMSSDNPRKKKATKQDWSRFDAMTAEERHAAALADPDAQPLTPERLERVKRTPQVFVIRRALRLSQEEFAAKFHIPLGTLRDWEQGRKEPDSAARAYLKVIARNPSAVAKALRPATA